MSGRSKRKNPTQSEAGDFRCPEHHQQLVFQASEDWWRCLTPHCQYHITVQQIIEETAKTFGAAACPQENSTSSESTQATPQAGLA